MELDLQYAETVSHLQVAFQKQRQTNRLLQLNKKTG